ncbi:MAG: GNAT family N-acetyltransferase [bacterium]|nr:GNAT family N-acetyltransferase [bacterium]MCP4968072.1 GNAT family N-acetyltransferase [bacterium]
MLIDQLSLRDITEADLPTIFEHEQDPEAIRMAAFTHQDPSNRDAFMAHWHRLFAVDTVVTKAVVLDKTVVGHIASWVQEGDREITYWIDRNHWGKGIATTALQLFLADMETRPLWARTAKDNVGSIRVLEKCGFETVGQDRGFANARGEEIDELVLRLDS